MSKTPEGILRAIEAAKAEIVKAEGQKGYDAILAGEHTPPEVLRVLARARKSSGG